MIRLWFKQRRGGAKAKEAKEGRGDLNKGVRRNNRKMAGKREGVSDVIPENVH